ncbi:MAG: hypothetical protein GF401_08755 [Chitinivibrionales bacterium]|nr:hypothetical protein [Chitinivibrionales bacterium]
MDKTTIKANNCQLSALLLAWVITLSMCIAADLSMDGAVRTGYGYENDGYFDLTTGKQVKDASTLYIVVGQLDIEAVVTDDILAFMEIYGDINDLGFILREAWIEFDAGKKKTLRIGSQKKDFSLEERSSRHDLRTIERSLSHRYMDSFHVLGYDWDIRFKRERERSENMERDLYVSMGIDGDIRFFLLGTLEWEWPKRKVVVSLMPFLHNRHLPYGFAGSALQFFNKRFYFTSELFVGIDPHATRLSGIIEEERFVYFITPRVLGAYTKWAKFLRVFEGIEFVLGLSVLFDDAGYSQDAKMQAVPGVTLLFDQGRDAVWKTNVDLVFSNERPDHVLVNQSLWVHTQLQVEW